jgi:hypothetical protein
VATVVVEPIRTARCEVETLDGNLAADPQTRVTMVRHLSRDPTGRIGAPQFNHVLGLVREEKSECHKDINEVG